jgi:MHS family proline/betaine transporter-like MFS transporter
MFTMAFSTTAIGLLPTYEQVGVVAPLALLVLRVLQGFSFGAEMPGATTIVSEFSPKNKLGILSSMVLSSTVLGSVCATGILALLTHFCTHQEIINGYWRVPFLIGGMLAIVAYFIRRSITETPEFTDHKTSCGEQKMLAPLAMLIKGHFGKLMMGFSMTLFLATNIIINISFPAYIHQYFSYPLADIYLAMTISLMVSFLFMLIFGFLSDHIAKLKMLLGCLVIWAISLSPLFQLLHTGTFWALQLFLIINQLCIAVFFTNYIPILPRLFPINIRYTAVALGYNVGFSIASAIPMTASYFLEQIQPSTTAFYFLAQMNPSITLQLFYVVPLIMALVSVILLMIQTKGKGYVW